MQLHIQISPQLKQVMTMEAIQHLEILQLANDELAQTVSEKALENPLLQVEDTGNWSTFISSYKKRCDSQSYPIVQRTESIVDFLLELMPLHEQISGIEERVLRYLIHNLDERLFLAIEVEDVAKQFALSEKEVIGCIELLQSFEPFGVATKNSMHFMEIQAKLDVLAPPFAVVFVKQELSAIAKLQLQQLMKKYKLSKAEVLTTIAYIKTLQPFPKFPTLAEEASVIIPDMELAYVAGEWIIEMNNQLLPKVSLNERYVVLLQEEPINKAYYEQNLKDALLLIEGIEERRKTMYRIMRWLLHEQALFLEKGTRGLKPLRLKDAANELQLHESTISRAIRNKYVRTPFGVIALKEFFPKGITYTENPRLTSESIKQRIMQLIASESATQPLSDQQLVECLQQECIHISRRTVAKYRESLHIPNSTKRAYL